MDPIKKKTFFFVFFMIFLFLLFFFCFFVFLFFYLYYCFCVLRFAFAFVCLLVACLPCFSVPRSFHLHTCMPICLLMHLYVKCCFVFHLFPIICMANFQVVKPPKCTVNARLSSGAWLSNIMWSPNPTQVPSLHPCTSTPAPHSRGP